jgi:hypothetical protein
MPLLNSSADIGEAEAVMDPIALPSPPEIPQPLPFEADCGSVRKVAKLSTDKPVSFADLISMFQEYEKQLNKHTSETHALDTEYRKEMTKYVQDTDTQLRAYRKEFTACCEKLNKLISSLAHLHMWMPLSLFARRDQQTGPREKLPWNGYEDH